MRHQIIRRTIGWLLSVILAATAGYQLAWHKADWEAVYADRPLQTIGLLMLVIVALVVIAWSLISDSRRSTLAGLLAAFAAGAWGLYVLNGINGWFLLASFGVILVLVALGGMTLYVACPSRSSRIIGWWNNRRAARAAAPNPDEMPARAPRPASPAAAPAPTTPVAPASGTPTTTS